jgi:hypothetical protein
MLESRQLLIFLAAIAGVLPFKTVVEAGGEEFKRVGR